LPGIEGAMDGSFLRGKFFIIFGSVIELNPDAKAATAAATTMLESFGEKVKGRFSKEIEFLLAGKDIDARKIRDATKKSVQVINLNRLQRLFKGDTSDSLSQLPGMTYKDFKGVANDQVYRLTQFVYFVS